MKSRIATFLIAVCMFLTGTAFANQPKSLNSEASKAIAELLKKELKYPKFAKEEKFECCLLVRLIIKEDGSFEVDCANCMNDNIKNHVTAAIEKISKEELKKYAGQEFNYKINFKLLN